MPEIMPEKKRAFKEKVLQKAPKEKAFFVEDWAYKVQYETDNTMVILTVPTKYEDMEAPEVLAHQRIDEFDDLSLVRRSHYSAHPENNRASYSEELDVYDSRTGKRLPNNVIDIQSSEGLSRYKDMLNHERSLGMHTFTEEKYQEVMSLLDELRPEQIVER